ncbi:hypothetical protein TeGR_g4851 [Tetraparma gracilis]|uniref:Uncharacterized protein n=1 Tax=Tetraparma gracilis TaxID=2962635 RepID=A0ABQ6MHW6_9STRA|nr:hypothetical protein TeGR_g4851 [Tetraparma gracilis]
MPGPASPLPDVPDEFFMSPAKEVLQFLKSYEHRLPDASHLIVQLPRFMLCLLQFVVQKDRVGAAATAFLEKLIYCGGTDERTAVVISSVWDHPGLPDALLDAISATKLDTVCCLAEMCSHAPELRIAMASNPRLLDIFVSSTPSDTGWRYLYRALDLLCSDPAALDCLTETAWTAVSSGLGRKLIRMLSIARMHGTADGCDGERAVVMVSERGRNSEFMLLLILTSVEVEPQLPVELLLSAEFLSTLVSNHDLDVCVLFVDNFCIALAGSSPRVEETLVAAIFNSDRMLDASYTEMVNPYDDDLKKVITRMVLMISSRIPSEVQDWWTKLARHESAPLMLSRFLGMVAEKEYDVLPRPELLFKIEDFMSMGVKEMFPMLGACGAYVDEVLAEIEEMTSSPEAIENWSRSGIETVSMLYIVLGSCIGHCSKDRRARIDDAASAMELGRLVGPEYEVVVLAVFAVFTSFSAILLRTNPDFPRFKKVGGLDRMATVLGEPSVSALTSYDSLCHVVTVFHNDFSDKVDKAMLNFRDMEKKNEEPPPFEIKPMVLFGAKLKDFKNAVAPCVRAEVTAEEQRKAAAAEEARLAERSRYERSETRREVDQRKRQRNLEDAARVMAAHAQKQAEAEADTVEAVEAQIAALGLDLAPLTAPDALAETAEDIEAQIAALGLPPDFDPAPPPFAAPDAFMETLLATANPPAPAPLSLMEKVRALHLEVYGADMPVGIGVAAAVALVEEGLLGGATEGGIRERVDVLEKTLSG